jgi:hypothetical protein
MALGMTVAQLGRSMTTDELTYWRAFERLEPFGSPARHWCAALIAQMLANIHRTKKTKAFKLEEFLPNTRLRQRVASQELSSKLISFFKAAGKKAKD